MSNFMKYDIAIIGGGAGGLSVAAVASQLGLKVVLAEENKMGGDCLNYGCIPSKSILAAAKTAHAFLAAGQFGISSVAPVINFAGVLEHVTNVIRDISKQDSVERFRELGVDVIQAPATFINNKTIKAGNTLIQARRFVIASGSSPALPPITGLNQVNFLTNETIFSLQDAPKHLLVIGGGPIGCELAQAFRFLGIEVTILEAFKIMPRDEQDLVQILREKFIRDGIILHEHIKVVHIKKSATGVDVIIEKNGIEQTISGSHILVAAGRRPNVTSLDLEKAQVEYTSKGIEVDSHLQTTNKRIYAIGDVIGGYQFTHIANYHAAIVIRNIIFKLPAKIDYRAIPWVTYTSPELAHTGLTSDEALKQFKNAKILESTFANNDRAQAEHETIGKIKVIVTNKGKIIGCSILGPHAGDLIVPWIMLIKEGKTLRDLTETIIPYPTFSEISKRVASEYYAPSLFSTKVRKLVSFLKYLSF